MGPGPGISSAIRLSSALTPDQRELYQNPVDIKRVLNEFRTVAIVGLSSDDQKASFFVASYLRSAGYQIVPINPRADSILGRKVYRSLLDIPFPVDVVDVFRPAAECTELVEQAITIKAKGFWQQLRIINLPAAERARSAGLIAVVDKCMKMEHGRYSGGLHEAGMNSELISARRIHRFY